MLSDVHITETVISDTEKIVKVIAPKSTDNTASTPCAMCLVIDVSASMYAEANIKKADGQTESMGFSLLDMAKISAITMLRSNIGGYVSILSYATQIKVEQDWICISDANIESLVTSITNIQLRDQTNFMEAMLKGISQFCKLTHNSTLSNHLILLTDGDPTVNNPPRINTYLIKRNEALNEIPLEKTPTITTIGLGNQIKSDLLNLVGHFYLFIPDTNTIGPVIVNLISAIKSTLSIDGIAVKKVILHVGEDNEREIIHLQYDDVRTFIVDATKQIKVTFNNRVIQTVSPIQLSDQEIKMIKVRHDIAFKIGNFLDNTRPQLQYTGSLWSHDYSGVDDKLEETIQCEGGVNDGLTKYASTWGRHFAYMFMNCLLSGNRQVNFLDEALRIPPNSKILYEKLLDTAETYFMKTSVQPSLLKHTISTAPPSAVPAITTLPEEFLRGGGCFGPNGSVFVKENKTVKIKKIKDISVGDLIAINSTQYTEVLYKIKRDNIKYYRYPIEITPWHPIKKNGEWVFPRDIYNNEMILGTVYNFVTKHGTILVNGIECVTLGHEIKEGIAKHEYWGSTAVVNDIKQFINSPKGYIVIENAVANIVSVC